MSIEQAKIEDTKTTSLVKKFNRIRSLITVEPLIGLYQFAIFISKPALENLELEKACRVNWNYNDTICDSILAGNHKNYSMENNNIQIVISKMHSWQQPIQSFMPLLLIVFLGSYSDRHKWRKPFFIVPLLGDILGYIGNILSVFFMRTWPLEVQGVFQKIIPSIFGTQPMIIMATTSYIADVSSKEDRTLRIGLATLTINVAIPTAQAISGILFKHIGYYGVLILSSCILVIAFLYGVFWVTEKSSLKDQREKCSLFNVFSPKDAIDTFGILFKKSPQLGRIHLMLIFAILQRCASDGEDTIMFLYVQKVFQFTPVDFSYFRTANSITTLLGNITGLCIFVKILKMDDLVIIFITLFTRLLSQVVFGCASTSLVFYSGILLCVVTRLNRIAKRSYATKIVSENDIGKTISLLGIAEALAPVAAVPAYNILYQNTLQVFPATVFFFSVILYTICCFLVVFMYLKDKKFMQKEEKLKKENPDISANIETTYM